MAFAPKRRRQSKAPRRPPVDAEAAPRVDAEVPALLLPHEQDESTREAGRTSSRNPIAQAADDLAAGLVDTDCHDTPGLPSETNHRR